MVSRIDEPLVTPIPDPTRPVPLYNQQYFPTARHAAWGDFNGDGLNDIVMCPSFFASNPRLPCEIWLNRGGGRFTIGTSEVVDGAIGVQANVNNIFVTDFNKDGRPDIFIVAQGLETFDMTDPWSFRDHNRVFMSQPDGKLKDITGTGLASDTIGFHHISAVGDVNGDGWPDVVVVELGGLPGQNLKSGVYFLLNDRAGGFTYSTAGLPADLATVLKDAPGTDQTIDRLGPGAIQIVDLDGDGRQDLVATTYIDGTSVTRRFETRIYGQQLDGSFLLRQTIPYADETLALVGSNGLRPGASGIAAGDLNGDGRPDIVVLFEGGSAQGNRIQILRNDGNYNFADVTVDWFGRRQVGISQPQDGTTTGVAAVALRDLNGDGKLDLAFTTALFHNSLADNSPFYLNDGTGKFAAWVPLIGGQRFLGQSLPDPQWQSLLKIPYTNPTSLMAFDATGDGLVDWVFIDTLLTAPETQPQINGMYVNKTIFTRVVPQKK